MVVEQPPTSPWSTTNQWSIWVMIGFVSGPKPKLTAVPANEGRANDVFGQNDRSFHGILCYFNGIQLSILGFNGIQLSILGF